MDQQWRPSTSALVVLGLGVGTWALLRFGLPAWLLTDKHEVRNVLEGLSWLVAPPTLILMVLFEMRSRKRAVPPDSSSESALHRSGERSTGDHGVVINEGVHGHGSGPTIGAVTGGQIGIGQAPPDPSPPART